MNKQTKEALERVSTYIDERTNKQRGLDPEMIHAMNDKDLLTADLRQLVEALTSPIGELFRYSEWLDSQSIINGDVELTDDSGNVTGEFDTRSHEQLVADYLKED